MHKRIGVMVLGLGLSLPALTAVGSRMILSGKIDAVTASTTMAKRSEARPEIRVGGAEVPHSGVPCRRSAGDPVLEAAPKYGMAPKSGCNLRLVKRRPGEALIWV